MTYFIRVNGKTLHNNIKVSRLYVPNEPPIYPTTYFNALNYCLRNNVVRIGWPDTGDLRKQNRSGALSRGYTPQECTQKHQNYLSTFARIPIGSTIVMPDSDNPGEVYLGEVDQPYHYFHDVPTAPYEHSHRLSVRWLKDNHEMPIRFFADELNLSIKGGVIWPRAFAVLDESPSGRIAARLISEKMKSRARSNEIAPSNRPRAHLARGRSSN